MTRLVKRLEGAACSSRIFLWQWSIMEESFSPRLSGGTNPPSEPPMGPREPRPPKALLALRRWLGVGGAPVTNIEAMAGGGVGVRGPMLGQGVQR